MIGREELRQMHDRCIADGLPEDEWRKTFGGQWLMFLDAVEELKQSILRTLPFAKRFKS